MSDWPPTAYIGNRPSAWRRLMHEPGEPVAHVHGCPECYEKVACKWRCTLEPDLELDDGTPAGGYMVCDECRRTKGLNDDDLRLGA